jgi:hypothetical protein
LPTASTWKPRVVANLAYLDIAVALSLWREWELSELLTSPHAGVPAPRRMKKGVGGGRETDQAWSFEPGYEFG